jgi:hypothetical protein
MMARPTVSVRRAVLSIALGTAAAMFPLLAALGGQTGDAAPQISAQPITCSNGETDDPFTGQCVPEMAPGGTSTASGNEVSPGIVASGAPSESEVTDTTPGSASPSHR